MELVKTFSKAWKIPEIRQKIIFTLLMLLVYRIGSNIPVPGIDREYLAQMFSGETGLLDLSLNLSELLILWFNHSRYFPVEEAKLF